MTPAPTPLPVSRQYDLRTTPVPDAVDRVQQALGTRLDMDRAVVKRRSIGAATGRGSWVRVELRGLDRADGQGWGLEATSVLRGVPAPAWHAGFSWFDPGRRAMWRADETSLVTQAPVARASAASGLPGSWWDSLHAALEALARHHVHRRATPDCEPITQDRITTVIERVFPGQVDSTTTTWTAAHADLNWANMVGPDLRILDWEDWGMAPRGTDAARLWFASLTEPVITGRVRTHLAADLASRDGQIMALWECAGWLALGNPADPLTATAAAEAARLIHGLAGPGIRSQAPPLNSGPASACPPCRSAGTPTTHQLSDESGDAMNISEARASAQRYLDSSGRTEQWQRLVIFPGDQSAEDLGWAYMFHYNTERYLETRDYRDAAGPGGGPLAVAKKDGEVFETGGAPGYKERLAEEGRAHGYL